MPTVTTFLTFRDGADAAIERYTSVFPDSKVESLRRWGPGGPAPEGTLMGAEIVVAGHRLMILNGVPFDFTEAFSLFVKVETQEEVDRYSDALIAGGGTQSNCGWLKDPWGVSWQIVPRILVDIMASKDKAASARGMKAMMGMKRLDVAALKKAFEGA